MSPVAQARGVDGGFGGSLVCIGGVLSLAVVATALQKLHKCVTQNTTELLQDTGRKAVSHRFRHNVRHNITGLDEVGPFHNKEGRGYEPVRHIFPRF